MLEGNLSCWFALHSVVNELEMHCSAILSTPQSSRLLPDQSSQFQQHFKSFLRIPSSHPILIQLVIICLVGGFNLSEKYESQLGLLFPTYGKIKFMFQTTKTPGQTLRLRRQDVLQLAGPLHQRLQRRRLRCLRLARRIDVLGFGRGPGFGLRRRLAGDC